MEQTETDWQLNWTEEAQQGATLKNDLESSRVKLSDALSTAASLAEELATCEEEKQRLGAVIGELNDALNSESALRHEMSVSLKESVQRLSETEIQLDEAEQLKMSSLLLPAEIEALEKSEAQLRVDLASAQGELKGIGAERDRLAASVADSDHLKVELALVQGELKGMKSYSSLQSSAVDPARDEALNFHELSVGLSAPESSTVTDADTLAAVREQLAYAEASVVSLTEQLISVAADNENKRDPELFLANVAADNENERPTGACQAHWSDNETKLLPTQDAQPDAPASARSSTRNKRRTRFESGSEAMMRQQLKALEDENFEWREEQMKALRAEVKENGAKYIYELERQLEAQENAAIKTVLANEEGTIILEQQVADLEQQLIHAHFTIKSLKETVDLHNDEELEQDLLESKSTMTKLHKQIRELKTEKMEIEWKGATLKAELTSTKEILETRAKVKTVLEERLIELESQLDLVLASEAALKEQLAARDQEKHVLRTSLGEVGEEKSELGEQLEQVEVKLGEMLNMQFSLNQQLAEKEDEKEHMQSSLNQLLAEKEDENEHMQLSLNQQLAEKESEKEQLGQRRRRRSQELVIVCQEKDELEQRSHELEAQLSEMMNTQLSLKQQLAQKDLEREVLGESMKQQLAEQLAEKDNERDVLGASSIEVVAQLSDVCEEKAALEERFFEVQNKLSDSMNSQYQLKQELAAADEQKTVLGQSLGEVENKLSDTLNNQFALKQNLAEKDNEKAALSQSLKEAEAKLSNVCEEKVVIGERLGEVEAQLSTVCEEKAVMGELLGGIIERENEVIECETSFNAQLRIKEEEKAMLSQQLRRTASELKDVCEREATLEAQLSASQQTVEEQVRKMIANDKVATHLSNEQLSVVVEEKEILSQRLGEGEKALNDARVREQVLKAQLSETLKSVEELSEMAFNETSLKVQLATAAEEKTVLRQRLGDAERELSDVWVAKTSLVEQLRDMEARVSEMLSTEISLKDQLSAKVAEKTELGHSLGEADDTLTKALDSQQLLKKQLAEIEKEKDQLYNENCDAASTIATLKDQLAATAEEKSILNQTAMNALKDQLALCERDKQSALDCNSLLEQAHQQHNAIAHNKAVSTQQKIEESNTKLQEKVSVLEGQLTEALAAVTPLMEQLAFGSAEKERLEKVEVELSLKLEDANSTVAVFVESMGAGKQQKEKKTRLMEAADILSRHIGVSEDQKLVLQNDNAAYVTQEAYSELEAQLRACRKLLLDRAQDSQISVATLRKQHASSEKESNHLRESGSLYIAELETGLKETHETSLRLVEALEASEVHAELEALISSSLKRQLEAATESKADTDLQVESLRASLQQVGSVLSIPAVKFDASLAVTDELRACKEREASLKARLHKLLQDEKSKFCQIEALKQGHSAFFERANKTLLQATDASHKGE